MGNSNSSQTTRNTITDILNNPENNNIENLSNKIPIGNWSDVVKNSNPEIKNGTDKFTFIVGKSNNADPSMDCDKNFNANYSCGINGNNKNINIVSSRGKGVSFDCSEENNKCVNTKLLLNDNGNLILTDSDNNNIWSSNTNKVGVPLEKNKAENGKYGRNYLKPFEFLNIDEFIGSPSGNCYLIMTGEGNLELRYELENLNCNNNISNSWEYDALYSVDKLNVYKKNLGKIGYITKDSTIREYPKNMINRKTDSYNFIGNYDMYGNDVKIFNTDDENTCKKSCSDNNDCYGYIYDSNKKKCQIKNEQIFTAWKGSSIDKHIKLYTKIPSIKNNDTCSNSINNITAFEWDKYSKEKNMNMNTECGLKTIVNKENDLLEKNNNNIKNLTNELNNKLRSLNNSETNINKEIRYNYNKNIKNIKDYENINKQHTINDNKNILFKGMHNDSVLNLKYENYKYSLLSLVSILCIISFMKVIRTLK